jgi:Xaa-Pro dipeptidase
MTAFSLPFSMDEYQARVAAVRAEMAKRGVDILLIHTPENMLYLTGYQTAGYFSYQCLALPIDGEPAILTRKMEEGNARLLSWVQHRFSYTDMEDKVAKTIQMVRQFSRVERLGIEKCSWFLTVANYERLVELLGPIQVLDCSKLVDQVRLVKSVQEITYIREAARIADVAMTAGMQSIREGATENDIAAAVSDAAIRAGSEYTGIPHLIKSGERCSIAHAVWDKRSLQRGDTVYMELSGCVKRYTAVVMRTAQLAPEDPAVRRAAEIVIESLNRTIEMIRPGITTGELYEVARSVIMKAGFPPIPRRMGYSLGLGFPPIWGEWDTLAFNPNGKTELLPGMVFHVIPAIPLNERATIGFTETVLVTDKGNEVLTAYPRIFRVF